MLVPIANTYFGFLVYRFPSVDAYVEALGDLHVEMSKIGVNDAGRLAIRSFKIVHHHLICSI